MDLVWLDSLPIEASDVLCSVYVVSGLIVLALFVPRFGLAPMRRRYAWWALAAGIGALVGASSVWLTVDVEDVFGAPASDVIRGAVTAAGAVAGFAVASMFRARWWRRVIAGLAIVAAATSAGLIVNRDVAYYPKLGDVFGFTGVTALDLSKPVRDMSSTPAMPATGTLGTTPIVGTVSHFNAREAWVYLPPAALVPDPPKLPVVIAMAGQPGGPSDVFIAGGLKTALDDIAAAHHGVAPIVVVPDQLGGYDVNPMCVDSPIGHVETYVTVDVRRWVLQHLPVTAARTGWAVAGFSQGATCAVQFATKHPDVFGSAIAVSPEIGPFDGTRARTVQEAFGGSTSAWRAAQPIEIMHRHHHYRDTAIVYAVGANDRRYGRVAPKLAAVSRSVGMHVTFQRFRGLAHNWNVGAAGLEFGLHTLLPVWGIR